MLRRRGFPQDLNGIYSIFTHFHKLDVILRLSGADCCCLGPSVAS